MALQVLRRDASCQLRRQARCLSTSFGRSWSPAATSLHTSVQPAVIRLFGGGAAAVAATWATGLRASSTVAAAETSKVKLVETIGPEVRLDGSKVSLYQFESCPFCRKVRSCLDYHKIPYEIIEVDPLNKKETKEVAPDYRKVPILRIDTLQGDSFQLRDSKTIVTGLLEAKGGNPGIVAKVPPPAATSSTGQMWKSEEATGTVEEQWVRWTDKVLVQCIVLNVYRTMSESAETFSYLLTHPNFSWFARQAAALSGTVVMWGVAKSRKKKYAVPDERLALFEAVEAFGAAVKEGGQTFAGGAKPGAVDFNVYGILRSAEGCQTERDMLKSCPGILPWYTAMTAAVGPTAAINASSITRGAT